MQCQDADRNVENNLNQGTFRGVKMLCGNRFSTVIASMGPGTIQSEFNLQTDQPRAL